MTNSTAPRDETQFLSRLPEHHFLRVWLLAAHPAPSKSPFVEDRTEATGSGPVHVLRRHDQTSCLRLMGKKLLVALTMEGKFAGEGLQTVDEDDDMLAAMARELVEKNWIGDNADAIWRALHLEQKLFPGRQEDADNAGKNGDSNVDSEPANLIEAAINAEPVLIFGRSSESLKAGRRRSRPTASEQPSLSDWN